jgi:mannose-6-phosphate isomerase-like protein (cupin superfamily)
VHVLAGEHGQPPGLAAMETTIPANFVGPIPHAHEQFDQGSMCCAGRMLVAGDDEPQEAAAGSTINAPCGHRHAFSNPYLEDALVLGTWSPAEPALAFLREIGAALQPGKHQTRMRDIYARHASRLLP